MVWFKVAVGAARLAHKVLKAYKKSKKIKPVVDKKIKPVVKDYAKETKGVLKDAQKDAVNVITKIPGATTTVLLPTIVATTGVRIGAKKVIKSKVGKAAIAKSKSLKAKLKNIWKQGKAD